MNMHRATLVPVKETELSGSTEIGRDDCELIEAAIGHHLQYFIRLQGVLKAEKTWWERRHDDDRAMTNEEAAFILGGKIQKLRKLSDQISAAHAVHIVPEEE